MTSRPALAAGTTVLLLAAAATASATTRTTTPAPATSSTARANAAAVFTRGLLGTSDFTQRAGMIRVRGAYADLIPGQSYFTVIYANATCDPAQAFPVGPFTAGPLGGATLDVTVPAAVPVGGTRSVSVRRGDSAQDQDHDGKTGPSDVVAVPGQPAVGLVECDSLPVVTQTAS